MKTKNKYKHLLYLLLLILAFGSSCRKSISDYCVEGTVRSTFDNSPVAGATVELIGKRSDGFSSTTESIESTSTDANGRYRFKFKKVHRNGYQVVASHPKYFGNPIPGEAMGVLDGGKNNKLDLVLTPEAYIKLYTKRVSSSIFLQISTFYVLDGDTSREIKYSGKIRGGAYTIGGSIAYTVDIKNPDNTISSINKVTPRYTVIPLDTISYTLEW
jgi:hypothetical protein